MHFDFGDDPAPLEVRVALSAVGTQGARANLEAETAGRTFDELVAGARGRWSDEMALIEAEGDEGALRMLYTSLYHTMINPSVYQDVDGRYRGLDHEIHEAEEGRTNYTIFSVWDTYRALHPLFNLICPERSRDIVASMLDHYRQSVHHILPVWSHMANENWCMIGYHGVSVVGDALDKGIGIDRRTALEAMVRSANCDYYDATGVYKRLGYVPCDVKSTGSSMTLEYAYDDWVIYDAARKAGNAALAEEYRQRALNYRNVFDPETGFARGRMSDGSWKPDPNLYDTHGQGLHRGQFVELLDVCAARSRRADRTDGRRPAVRGAARQPLHRVSARPLFRTDRGRDPRRAVGHVCPRQRAEPPRPVSLHVDLAAVEDAVLGARDHGPDVSAGDRRVVRQRRLRADVGLVHLHGHGILSRLPGFGPVCARGPYFPI